MNTTKLVERVKKGLYGYGGVVAVVVVVLLVVSVVHQCATGAKVQVPNSDTTTVVD